MDLNAIRTRLAGLLGSVDGLYVYPHPLDTPPVAPAAVIAPAPGQFADQVTMDGAYDIDFTVTILVDKQVETVAQQQLDGYAATIPPLFESGHTADWDFATASPARGYGQYAWGEGEGAIDYLGFEIPVRIGAVS